MVLNKSQAKWVAFFVEFEHLEHRMRVG